MARLLAVPVGAISHSISTGANSAPQCAYRVHSRERRGVEVLANDEVVQAAYFVIERAIDEDAQYWGVGPMTIACLLRNTLIAACRRRGLAEPAL